MPCSKNAFASEDNERAVFHNRLPTDYHDPVFPFCRHELASQKSILPEIPITVAATASREYSSAFARFFEYRSCSLYQSVDMRWILKGILHPSEVRRCPHVPLPLCIHASSRYQILLLLPPYDELGYLHKRAEFVC